MTVAEVTTKRGEAAEDRDVFPPPPPQSHTVAKPRAPIAPFLITLGTVVLAGFLGWALWRVYVGSPWTRDATVRALVVTTDVPLFRSSRGRDSRLKLFHFSSLWEFSLRGYLGGGEGQRGGDGDPGGFEQSAHVVARRRDLMVRGPTADDYFDEA